MANVAPTIQNPTAIASAKPKLIAPPGLLGRSAATPNALVTPIQSFQLFRFTFLQEKSGMNVLPVTCDTPTQNGPGSLRGRFVFHL